MRSPTLAGSHRPTSTGVAELWFDDLAAVEAARRSPEWQASTEDEANFVDPARYALFLTVERDIPATRPEALA